MTTPEERVGKLLADEAERYQPAPDGLSGVRQRLRIRARRRTVRRVAVPVLAVAVVVATTVAIVHDRGPGQNVATSISSTIPRTGSVVPPTGPAELITVTATHVEVLSPSTGAVIRSVKLTPPLPSPPYEQIASDPSGRTVYVGVLHPAGTALDSCPLEVLGIDTRTGGEHVIALAASAPAVNAAGTMIAYLTGHGPPPYGRGPSCTATTVTVENLTTGARHSWPLTKPARHGRDPQALLTLSWAPQGNQLVVGIQFGPPSGILILDTTKPLGATNPTTVAAPRDHHGPTEGRFLDPLEQPDGSFVAIERTCDGDTSCAAGPASEIVAVDRRTATVTSTLLPLQHRPALIGLLANPTGRGLIIESPQTRGRIDLYKLKNGKLTLLEPNVGLTVTAAH